MANIDTRVKVLRQLSQLNVKDAAYYMSYVDVIFDTYRQIKRNDLKHKVYYSDPKALIVDAIIRHNLGLLDYTDFNQELELFPHSRTSHDKLKSLMDIYEMWDPKDKQTYICIMPASDLRDGSTLVALQHLAEKKSDQILPVFIYLKYEDADLETTYEQPLFRPYYHTYADCFGDVQGKPEAALKQIDEDFLDEYKKQLDIRYNKVNED